MIDLAASSSTKADIAGCFEAYAARKRQRGDEAARALPGMYGPRSIGTASHG